MSDELRPILVSTTSQAGAARAAARLHLGLRSAGCAASFLTRRPSSLPAAIHYSPSSGPLWAIRRLKARIQIKIDRHGSLMAYLRNQSIYGKDFSTERSIACDLHQQVMGYSLVHLHSVFRFVHLGTFLPPVAARMPIVWTLHNLHPMTGGCTYDMGCDRYLQNCGLCPMLAKRGKDDLSAISFRRKQRLYQSIPADRMHIIGPSRWIANTAADSPLLGRFAISVIPNGVDVNIYRPFPQQMARMALGIQTRQPIIAHIAADPTHHRKGALVLTRALEELRTQKDVFVLSAGHGEPHHDLHSMHVGTIGDETKLAQVYSAADVVVCPSLQDNLPNVVMEAMACGTPTVVSDSGGLPEMVLSRKTGEVVSAGDHDSLAWTLAQLTDHPDTLKAMRPACREHAERHYSLELCTRRHLNLYHQVLQQAHSTPAREHG